MTPTEQRAVQRLQCTTALMMLAPLVQETNYPPDTDGAKLAKNCEKWVKPCWHTIDDKPFSASARKKLDSASKAFSAVLIDGHEQEECEPIDVAVALMAAGHLVFDVTCQTFGAVTQRCWRGLDKAVLELLKSLRDEYPESEERGYELYENLHAILTR